LQPDARSAVGEWFGPQQENGWAHHGNLGGLLAGSDPQLVDGGLGYVCPLLCIVQIVLNLPDTCHVAAYLLLLVDRGFCLLVVFHKDVFIS